MCLRLLPCAMRSIPGFRFAALWDIRRRTCSPRERPPRRRPRCPSSGLSWGVAQPPSRKVPETGTDLLRAVGIRVEVFRGDFLVYGAVRHEEAFGKALVKLLWGYIRDLGDDINLLRAKG